MTPLRNFGYKSLKAVWEPEPWRLLGQSLLCKDRFPALEELVIILIQDGRKLIDWEEEEDWAEGIDDVSVADVIVNALDVGGRLLVNVLKGNVFTES